MDMPRFSPPPIDFAIFAQLRARLTRAGVVAAVEPAKQLLASLVEPILSDVEGASSEVSPRVTYELPAATERFASRLAELGIQPQDVGEVLRQLRGLIGGQRALTPNKARAMRDALKAHATSNPPPEQRPKWRLRQDVDRQAEAAVLMATLAKARDA